MTLFKTLIHPTDFDEPSKEAFRVARQIARKLGAQVVVFHVVSPPVILNEDAKVILDPHKPVPVDLWAEYRRLLADTPDVTVRYSVVVGDRSNPTILLEEKVRELGEKVEDVLVVMGSHGRTGISRFLWGSKAEEVVRDFPGPVLVVKTPSPKRPGRMPQEGALEKETAPPPAALTGAMRSKP